jgi:hypothetical protein
MKTLFSLIATLIVTQSILIGFDLAQWLNFEKNDKSCYFKSTSAYLLFWLLTRFIQSVLPPLIALKLFWL